MRSEKVLVKDLVKLQMLCVVFVEKNTNLKCHTTRDLDRILTSNKLTCTFEEGVKNLKANILKYCKDSKVLLESVMSLEEKINNSHIKDLRFGLEPQKKFTREESELNDYRNFIYD